MGSEKDLREQIRKNFIGEAAFAGMYSPTTVPNQQEKQMQPHEVEVTDQTVGVMDYKFDPKQMQNPEYVLDKLEPYFDDIEVQYVGINEDIDGVSVNVKHRYRHLLDALMQHYGFTKENETWGNEMRSGKRVYSTRGGYYQGGAHGNYPMPFLLGELPGTGAYYEE